MFVATAVPLHLRVPARTAFLPRLPFLLLPLDQPGVRIQPIRQMGGGAEFNEVFFDGAAAQAGHVVGRPGEGWKVALTVLGHERNSSGGSGRRGGDFNDLLLNGSEVYEWIFHREGKNEKAN